MTVLTGAHVPKRTLAYEDLGLLAAGAWVLGTGGGGNPYYNLVAIKHLYRQGHSVNLIQPDELADDALVALVSFQGAPLVGIERLPDATRLMKAMALMERHLDRKFDAVMSMEIGGSNGVLPLLAAAVTGLPVVDADAMGRAFPDVSKTCFAVHDLSPGPIAIHDIRENGVIMDPIEDWFWAERISRKVVTEMGSTASTCKAPRSGAEVKSMGIHGSVSRAIAIGQTLVQAKADHRDPIAALLDLEDGLLLYLGKITDTERKTTEGFLRGHVDIEAVSDASSNQLIQQEKASPAAASAKKLRIEFQNEFSVARLEETVIATVPDLICVLDRETGEAIGTESLRYGQRVAVIALPSPPVFTSEKGLQHAGPRAFGFDLDFVSPFSNSKEIS
ncbi:MAG: DUF917 domain-containing protein [Rhodospirillaceae bacterium]|nr:DUF917 domain-containing protein [Rhodospirillaceae bacterium]